jgi:hypothetical protein
MILSTYSAQFKGDYKLSPAENARRYIDGLPGGAHESFDGISFDEAARGAFLDGNGNLDVKRVYREVIKGKDVFCEQRELMRYAIILDATKEEMGDLIFMMIGRYGPKSSRHPIARSRNTLQWKRQAEETFGISP